MNIPGKLISSTNLKESLVVKINAIIDCLWAMRIFSGAGIKLERRPTGIVISTAGRAAGCAAGASGESYDGPLSVYYDSKKAKLIIRPGWLIRNGEWIEIPKTELAPAAGYVVISSTLEESGWSAVEVKIGTPSATAYPIAYIEYENSKMKLKSYRTAVAVIMAVKTCPIAKMNQA